MSALAHFSYFLSCFYVVVVFLCVVVDAKKTPSTPRRGAQTPKTAPKSAHGKTPSRKFKPSYADVLKQNLKNKYMKLAKSAKKAPAKARKSKATKTPSLNTVSLHQGRANFWERGPGAAFVSNWGA